MKHSFGRIIFLLSLTALASFSGCTTKKPQPENNSIAQVCVQPTPEPALPAADPPKQYHPVAPPASSLKSPAHDYKRGRAALAQGRYETALRIFTVALKKRDDPEVKQLFDEALEGLIHQGDAAYLKGRFKTAGKNWTTALRYMELAKRNLPNVRAEVENRVDRLTSEQMDKGLIYYRKENLPEAIAAWKTILAYDPENKEAARAVRTATTQLENLKKIP